MPGSRLAICVSTAWHSTACHTTTTAQVGGCGADCQPTMCVGTHPHAIDRYQNTASATAEPAHSGGCGDVRKSTQAAHLFNSSAGDDGPACWPQQCLSLQLGCCLLATHCCRCRCCRRLRCLLSTCCCCCPCWLVGLFAGSSGSRFWRAIGLASTVEHDLCVIRHI